MKGVDFACPPNTHIVEVVNLASFSHYSVTSGWSWNMRTVGVYPDILCKPLVILIVDIVKF